MRGMVKPRGIRDLALVSTPSYGGRGEKRGTRLCGKAFKLAGQGFWFLAPAWRKKATQEPAGCDPCHGAPYCRIGCGFASTFDIRVPFFHGAGCVGIELSTHDRTHAGGGGCPISRSAISTNPASSALMYGSGGQITQVCSLQIPLSWTTAFFELKQWCYRTGCNQETFPESVSRSAGAVGSTLLSPVTS